ncbi:hypothetical protein BC828DRAFT_376014 [Blastocladiella britannica]|nr:hypothetical protein BC828DRAFT_376014 [Blastocladiella britannica]
MEAYPDAPMAAPPRGRGRPPGSTNDAAAMRAAHLTAPLHPPVDRPLTDVLQLRPNFSEMKPEDLLRYRRVHPKVAVPRSLIASPTLDLSWVRLGPCSPPPLGDSATDDEEEEEEQEGECPAKEGESGETQDPSRRRRRDRSIEGEDGTAAAADGDGGASASEPPAKRRKLSKQAGSSDAGNGVSHPANNHPHPHDLVPRLVSLDPPAPDGSGRLPYVRSARAEYASRLREQVVRHYTTQPPVVFVDKATGAVPAHVEAETILAFIYAARFNRHRAVKLPLDHMCAAVRDVVRDGKLTPKSVAAGLSGLGPFGVGPAGPGNSGLAMPRLASRE